MRAHISGNVGYGWQLHRGTTAQESCLVSYCPNIHSSRRSPVHNSVLLNFLVSCASRIRFVEAIVQRLHCLHQSRSIHLTCYLQWSRERINQALPCCPGTNVSFYGSIHISHRNIMFTFERSFASFYIRWRKSEMLTSSGGCELTSCEVLKE